MRERQLGKPKSAGTVPKEKEATIWKKGGTFTLIAFTTIAGIIDGKMGSYTREAIKAFQRKVGLIPDGVAGARTKSEMKSYTGC